VERLAELRRAGVTDFERAWRRAMHDVPAPWSWRPRPAWRGEAPVEFLRRQCERAWHGEHIGHDLHALGD
jgi:hypothetical protein